MGKLHWTIKMHLLNHYTFNFTFSCRRKQDRHQSDIKTHKWWIRKQQREARTSFERREKSRWDLRLQRMQTEDQFDGSNMSILHEEILLQTQSSWSSLKESRHKVRWNCEEERARRFPASKDQYAGDKEEGGTWQRQKDTRSEVETNAIRTETEGIGKWHKLKGKEEMSQSLKTLDHTRYVHRSFTFLIIIINNNNSSEFCVFTSSGLYHLVIQLHITSRSIEKNVKMPSTLFFLF